MPRPPTGPPDLRYLPEAAMPAALHEMTRRFLANPRHRAGYLSRWAPLITVGITVGTV